MQKISKEGLVKAGFVIDTDKLTRVLKILKSTCKNNWETERPYCEITIKTGVVEFVIAGIKQTTECESHGPARVVISFMHFLHLVTDRAKRKTKVAVGDDFMIVNEATVVVQTWFFENDTILRSIDLPVNYGIVEILKLSEKYTKEEIAFNNLEVAHRKAHEKLYSDIEKVKRILKPYKIEGDRIEEFLYDAIFKG